MFNEMTKIVFVTGSDNKKSLSLSNESKRKYLELAKIPFIERSEKYYNDVYFESLSNEAKQFYLELPKIPCIKRSNDYVHFELTDGTVFDFNSIKRLPLSNEAVHRYFELAEIPFIERSDEDDNAYFELTAGTLFEFNSIKRTDPFLVQVVEELGDEASADHCWVRIGELPKGTKFFIEDYGGREVIVSYDSIDWLVA